MQPAMLPEEALYQLLIDLFGGSGGRLIEFLRFLPEGERAVDDIPASSAPLSHIASAAVQTLRVHGLIDRTLFERLIYRFPRRTASIAAVAARWGISVPLLKPAPPTPRRPNSGRVTALTITIAALAITARIFYVNEFVNHPSPLPLTVDQEPPSKLDPASSPLRPETRVLPSPNISAINSGVGASEVSQGGNHVIAPSDSTKIGTPRSKNKPKKVTIAGCSYLLDAQDPQVSVLESALVQEDFPSANRAAEHLAKDMDSVNRITFHAAIASAQGAASRVRDIQGELDKIKSRGLLPTSAQNSCIEALRRSIE